jgi:hypothetical protein
MGLTVNLSKTHGGVPKKVQHTKHYTYLRLNISATGNFHKARRAFYAIKRNIKFNILIMIWLKILESVIEPIALYGCEVCGPLTNQDFTKWDKHTDFCRNILHVQRKTTN